LRSILYSFNRRGKPLRCADVAISPLPFRQKAGSGPIGAVQRDKYAGEALCAWIAHIGYQPAEIEVNQIICQPVDFTDAGEETGKLPPSFLPVLMHSSVLTAVSLNPLT
jgi:hypothetical protein